MGWLRGALKGLLWPAGAPIVAAWVYLQGEAQYPLEQWWPGLALVALALAALIGWRFGRGRIVAAAALIYFSLSFIQRPNDVDFQWFFVALGLSFLALAHFGESRLFRWRAAPLWLVGGWASSIPFGQVNGR